MPTLKDDFINITDGSYNFSGIISPLIEKKYYYVRAYATNLKGTSYSTKQIRFVASLPIPIEYNGTLYVFPSDNSSGIPLDNSYEFNNRDGIFTDIDVSGAESSINGLEKDESQSLTT